jgi:SAM-dependent methyltransferase
MSVERPSWAPSEVDITRPSVARVYDFYLGGSHNFESDREFAQAALRAFPGLPAVLREGRGLLRRLVLFLCEAGIDQFLDLGSGIPTEGNVHEIARSVCSRARVVYVDRDPVAVTHSRQLLAGVEQATVVTADIRDVREVLGLAVDVGGLDLRRPVAVLAVAVLHFVADDDRPGELMAEYMDALVPGSYLAISQAGRDGRQEAVDVQRVYNRAGSPHAMHMRTRTEIAALFGDLELVEPGLVPPPLWRPDPADDRPEVGDDYPGVAGLGRRR